MIPPAAIVGFWRRLAQRFGAQDVDFEGDEEVSRGSRLLWWRSGRLARPDELDQFIADGDRMRRLFMEER